VVSGGDAEAEVVGDYWEGIRIVSPM
jgi:hypothetical protein